MYQINSISISAPTDIQKKCGFPDGLNTDSQNCKASYKRKQGMEWHKPVACPRSVVRRAVSSQLRWAENGGFRWFQMVGF